MGQSRQPTTLERIHKAAEDVVGEQITETLSADHVPSLKQSTLQGLARVYEEKRKLEALLTAIEIHQAFK